MSRSYFEHNERRTQRPRPGEPDMVRPDFDPPTFSINGGIVVEETCGARWGATQCTLPFSHIDDKHVGIRSDGMPVWWTDRMGSAP